MESQHFYNIDYAFFCFLVELFVKYNASTNQSSSDMCVVYVYQRVLQIKKNIWILLAIEKFASKR